MAGYGGAPYGGAPYGGGGGSGGPPTASDTFASFSDSAHNSAYQAHGSASDSLIFSDAASSVSRTHALPSLYKLMPGIGARATPGTRNPVNHPRTFGTTRVHQPEQLSYGAYDTFAFSDAATRSPVGYVKTATDSLTFSDAASLAKGVSDSFAFSDSGSVRRTGWGTIDALTFSDSVSSYASFLRTSSDSLAFADSASGRLGLLRTSSDSLSFADSVRFGLSGRDSLMFADVAIRSAMHYTSTCADAFSFADSAVGPTGHNTRTSSDTLHFFDRPVSWTYDSFAFSDSAVAGLVFFAGYDSLTFSDTANPSGFVTNARVYQVYAETLIQTTDSQAYAYQAALEVAMTPPAAAHMLQVAEEVVVGKIYGQIWPIGWGEHGRGKGRYGQLWPRWSRDYTGGIGND